MASNSTVPDLSAFLPPSLNLPPHLSAHKYFFVCTLTVAAWDTLVLSPRTWKLLKTKEWPFLKIIFNLLRILMPAEFIVVAVAFFDTKWTANMCQHFFLFEPITTAVLVSISAAVHVIRIYAIYDKNKMLLGLLGAMFMAVVVVMAVTCAFYRPMPLKVGQGCIAGPVANWVGIYWLAPTFFFTTSFALAIVRSVQSIQTRPLSLWKLMLRDGLNLYGAIFIVNLVNVIFWFVAKPTDNADTIKTIVTSMAAVLTVTMTLRIILSVRGSLASGGAYAGSVSSTGATHGSTLVHSRTGNNGPSTHVLSSRGGVPSAGGARSQPAIIGIDKTDGSVDEMHTKSGDWADSDAKSSVANIDDFKGAHGLMPEDGGMTVEPRRRAHGVKVTVDTQSDSK